jgi:hypothetical protein
MKRIELDPHDQETVDLIWRLVVARASIDGRPIGDLFSEVAAQVIPLRTFIQRAKPTETFKATKQSSMFFEAANDGTIHIIDTKPQ